MKDFETLKAEVNESIMIAANTHAINELGYRMIETIFKHPSGDYNMVIGLPFDEKEEEGTAFVLGISPMTIDEVKEWLRNNSDVNVYHEVFDESEA